MDLWHWTGTSGELVIVAFGGFVGAIVKDLVVDKCLELPYKKDGKIYLGFFAAGMIGAFVGMVIDGSFITAALAGYSGSSLLSNLVNTGTGQARTLNLFKKTEVKARPKATVAVSK